MKRQRKVMIALVLTLGLLLGALATASAAKYYEAPSLAAQVKAGTLPAIEKRLPENPRVIEPLQSVGQYGGTARLLDWGPLGFGQQIWNWEPLFRISGKDYRTVIPNVAAGYEYSKDFKTLTVRLRKGMKWSDGHPLTADDFVFVYEDRVLNKELMPSPWPVFKVGGEVIKVSKVDDYTVKFSFAVPYPTYIYSLARFSGDSSHIWEGVFLPSHYVKKFHIKYNPKANEQAKEAGYSSWTDWFMTEGMAIWPNRPTLGAWSLKSATSSVAIYERNPYYFAVDTAGNQLPYIDKLEANGAGSQEVINLKVAAGEIDFTGMMTLLKDYALYKENEKKGGYTVKLWRNVENSVAYFLNQTHADPVRRKLFQNMKFKQALALAIDREELNELFWNGLAQVRNVTVVPESRFWEKDLEDANTDFNPKKARALLDEIGLSKRGKDGYRLGPDGKEFILVIGVAEGAAFRRSVTEVVARYWNSIGIKTAIKDGYTGEDLTKAMLDMTSNETSHLTDPIFIGDPNWAGLALWWGPAALWTKWKDTGGKEGEEPPAAVKNLFKLETILKTTTDEKERTEAGKAMLRFHAEQIYAIPTTGLAPQPVIVNSKLRNVPDKGYNGFETFWESIYQPSQFYYAR